MKLLASLDRRIESLKVELRLANCGLSSARHIPTFTTKMELHHLHHLAQCTPENARVLEIGSYLGASTSYIIAGMRGERRELVCVDTWQNDTMPDGTKDTFAEFSKNLRPLLQFIRPIRCRTRDLDEDILGGHFDMIFLDGDHSYDQTRHDFGVAARHLAAGGVVIFHDVLFFRGVSRVVGECLSSGDWKLAGVAGNLVWIRREKFDHVD